MIDIENFVETGELLPADLQLQQRQAGGFDGPVRQFPFDTRRGGRIIIPSGQDTIEPGDSVIVVTCSMGLGKLEDILARGPGHE